MVKVKVRFRWWSLRNWIKGYKFGPVQRFRCCDHTTPYHYPSCAQRPSFGQNVLGASDG